MTQDIVTLHGGPIFDGETIRTGHALRLEAGVVAALDTEAKVEPAGEVIDLGGDILSPGYVDLQVNGGDGVMFNDDPSPATLARIAGAHRRLGATTILPTLITDTPEQVRAAIAAVEGAVAAGSPGIAGLHLEGPHLSLARKGAHDPTLIRAMTDDDLATLLEAAGRLPLLMVTLAPENVTREQVRALSAAGVLLALGHTDADHDTAMAYADAGVRCATHLFNAMRQIGPREPGVVGAALSSPGLNAGLIADGHHVHPDLIRLALSAKRGSGRLFLVSDAMSVVGTEMDSFVLDGRKVGRSGGRLTLEDGTLAGADLTLDHAIRVMTGQVGVPLADALGMASTVPARLAGLNRKGRLAPDAQADLVWFNDQLDVKGCWISGQRTA